MTSTKNLYESRKRRKKSKNGEEKVFKIAAARNCYEDNLRNEKEEISIHLDLKTIMRLPYIETEEEENEFYGPIDGVRPRDYPLTYHELLHSSCYVKKKEIVTIFYQQDENCKVMCTECWETEHDPAFIPTTGYHVLATRRHLGYSIVTFCCRCLKRLLEERRHAHECTECIEEYFESYQKLMREGRVAVITRW